MDVKEKVKAKAKAFSAKIQMAVVFPKICLIL